MMKRIICIAAILLCLAAFVSSSFAKESDIIRLYSDVEISKDMVAGDVIAIGGNVTVFGKVENNIVAVGGSVFLKPNSSVGDEVVVVGGEITKDPLADIGGRITQIYMPHFIPSLGSFLKGGWIAIWATISMLALLGFLGIAILLASLIPENMSVTVKAIDRSFVKMLLWGMLWALLIVPIAVILAISIIGIILIPVEIFLAVLALIIGYIAAAIFLGKKVFTTFKKKNVSPLVEAVLGILVLFLIGFVPLVGAAVKAVFLMVGFGAVLTTRFGTVK